MEKEEVWRGGCFRALSVCVLLGAKKEIRHVIIIIIVYKLLSKCFRQNVDQDVVSSFDRKKNHLMKRGEAENVNESRFGLTSEWSNRKDCLCASHSAPSERVQWMYAHC